MLNEGKIVYPEPLPEPTNSAVPEPMRGEMDEAKRCFSIKAYRATSLMARRIIQIALIGKGANTKKTLFEQVKELRSKGIITEDILKATDAVRLVGNDAAHSKDFDVTEEEALEVLELAEVFLEALYVIPSITKKIKDRRDKTSEGDINEMPTLSR